jgi:hypothetical protein
MVWCHRRPACDNNKVIAVIIEALRIRGKFGKLLQGQ